MISALHCLPQLHPPRRKKLRQKMPPPPMHQILQIPRPKSPFRRRLPPRQHRVHGGILAWSTLDEHPHATTAHRQFHYVTPEQGCIRLAVPPSPGTRAEPRKYTVYAIEPSGSMLVGDVMI